MKFRASFSANLADFGLLRLVFFSALEIDLLFRLKVINFAA